MADVNIKIKLDGNQVKAEADAVSQSFSEMSATVEKANKTMDTSVNQVNKSLGEMKRELRELRNTSFAGKTIEEIKEVRARMADLTDRIGDFQAQVKTASADRIPALINGLQGIVAVTQGVTATLGLFGIENEKLEKSMIQLIGASQALSTIYDLYEKRTFKVAVANAKATVSEAAKTVVTKASAVATKAVAIATSTATVAQKAYNLALLASPIGIMAAAVAGLAYAFVELSGVVDEARIMHEVWNRRSREIMDDLIKSTNEYAAIIDDYNKKIQDYNDRNLTSGEKAKRDYLAQAEQQKLLIKGMLTQLQYKSSLIKAEIDHAKAQYEWMRWLQPDMAKIMQGGIEELEERYNKLNSTVNEGIVSYAKWESSIEGNANAIKNNLDFIDKKSKENNKTTAKAIEQTKELGDANEYMLQKYAKMVQDIGNSFESLLSIQSQLKPIGMTEEEEDNSIAELKTRLSVEYAMQKDQYRQLEILRQTAQISEEEYQDRIFELRVKNMQQYLSFVQDTFTNIGSVVDNLKTTETNKLEASNKEQTAALEEEYNHRIDMAGNNANKRKQVDEWYADQREKIDEEMTEKTLAIEKKYRKAQQAIAISNAIISGAQGLAAVWSNPVYVAAPPLGALISAMIAGVTATQIGVIASQKYAHGGYGTIEGRNHAEGGVNFFGGEAERGELWSIFNREATWQNTGLPSLIDAINQHQLVIDKDFMNNMHGDGGAVVLINNFKGGEHLAGMHDIMKRNERNDVMTPDGRIKKGIMRRRWN